MCNVCDNDINESQPDGDEMFEEEFNLKWCECWDLLQEDDEDCGSGMIERDGLPSEVLPKDDFEHCSWTMLFDVWPHFEKS